MAGGALGSSLLGWRRAFAAGFQEDGYDTKADYRGNYNRRCTQGFRSGGGLCRPDPSDGRFGYGISAVLASSASGLIGDDK